VYFGKYQAKDKQQTSMASEGQDSSTFVTDNAQKLPPLVVPTPPTPPMPPTPPAPSKLFASRLPAPRSTKSSALTQFSMNDETQIPSRKARLVTSLQIRATVGFVIGILSAASLLMMRDWRHQVHSEHLMS